MIVVIDNMMTASARFADILLPATSSFEESDLCYQSYGMELGALILRQKAIEPWASAAPCSTSAPGWPNAWGWERSSPRTQP
jgi:anaerobic dimethyl sulfoxide reductase subunit A